MRCPSCGNDSNRVMDSRMTRDGSEIRRRRQCRECRRRFTTRERIEEIFPKIIKKDGRREDYERRKLIVSLEKACQKRPMSANDLEKLVDRLEKRLVEASDKEVQSRFIGENVMAELVAIDGVAAARFASVFLDFQVAEDYTAFFSSLEKSSRE